MLEFLKNIDKELFLFFNGLHNPAVDFVMFYFTDTEFWFPFYGILIAYLFWKLKWKAIPVIAFTFAVVGVSDWIASGVMKPYFQRLRPCHEPSIIDMVRTIDGCGKKYGFVSSHASTTFGLAAFMWISLKNFLRPIVWLWLWAAVVSYSRIYAGEHYPGDIVVGGIIGVLIAFLFYWIFTKVSPLIPEKIRLESRP